MGKVCLITSHIFKTRKLENFCKGHAWEGEFRIPFWSIIHLLLRLNAISEMDNGI